MTNIDYSSAQFWLEVAQIIVMLLVAAYTYMANRTKANKGAIEQLSERVDGAVLRVGKLETEVKNMPDHDDIGALHNKVNGVSDTVSTISGQLSAMNNTLSLINEHLIGRN